MEEPEAGDTATTPAREPGGGAPAAPPRRRFLGERLLIRVIGTSGIIAIGVALGAILASSKVQGWIIGLVVAGVTVILSAILWSSKQF